MTPPEVAVYDSDLRPAPFVEEFRELLRYRDLVVQMVSRTIKTRYKRSVLGILWTMLNPLLMTLVLSVVFSELMRSTVPHFTVYLMSGIIAWNFFAQTTSAAMSELVWGGTLLNRIYMPKTIFAASALGTGLVNFVFSIPPLLLVMAFTHTPFRPSLLFIPVAMLLLAMFTIGLGLMLSAMAVYFSDVVEMFTILLTAWYFLTPILYTLDIITVPRRWLFKLNPLYYLIEIFRVPIHNGILPAPKMILMASLIATGMLAFGWWVFTRKADQFAYRV